MTKHKLVIDDFSTNKIEKGKVSFYNCNPNKSLKASMGIQEAQFLNKGGKWGSFIMPTGVTEIRGIYVFKQYNSPGKSTIYKMMLFADDNKTYHNTMYAVSFKFGALTNIQFESMPVCFTYIKDDIDTMVMAGADKISVWKTNYNPYTLTSMPEISSMCVSNGVLFCTINNPAYKVWYNKSLDMELVGSVDGNSGFLNFEDDLGSAKKIVAFNENLFVFRDYGISKVNRYKEEMTVDQVYKSETQIYCNTVSLCGNQILFMTKTGLYSFNGNKVSKLDLDITDIISSLDNAKAASLSEKYYLTLKLNYDDNKTILCEQNECTNNALLVYDTNDNSFQIIRGVDIKVLYPLKTNKDERMLVVLASEDTPRICEVVPNIDYFEEKIPKNWVKNEIFNDFSKKMITKLIVKSEGEITFTLNFDGVKQQFTTTNSGVNVFNLKRVCSQCNIEISSSNTSINVEKIELEYYDC